MNKKENINYFISLSNSETEYGEPQLWIYLDNGRSVEITHEEYNLPEDKQFYSVRLHCSEKEFDDDIFYATCGVIDYSVFKYFDKGKIDEWVRKVKETKA